MPNFTSQTPPVVLTIAGSDSGAGAGIQADLKTISALGAYGVSVITAITAQNTQGVRHVCAVDSFMVSCQLEAILTDFHVSAIKIGMLSNLEIVKSIATLFAEFSVSDIPVVLDPVLISSSGKRLLDTDAVECLISELFPYVTLLTPNLSESAALLNTRIPSTHNEMEKVARELLSLGPQSVLVKGGHFGGEQSPDFFVDHHQETFLIGKRIHSRNNHGTGCTLSSAIAAYLVHDNTLLNSVELAKYFLEEAMLHSKDWKLGKGIGPLHHFFERSAV